MADEYDTENQGHEGCGEVVATGPEATKFRPGDMVVMMIVPGCGQTDCNECSDGVPQLCLRGPRYGGGQDGFFAAYAKVTERAAVKLPSGVSVGAGAVATDACMTAYHAVVGRARVKRGETILILGLGGLGFNALQIVLHLGARAIVSDKRQVVLDEAQRFGVKGEDIVPANTTDVGDWIQKKGIRVDTAIDFVAMPLTFKAAVDSGESVQRNVSGEIFLQLRKLVRLAGTIVVVGLLSPELSLPTSKLVRKQLSSLGSYAGTISDLEACLDLISKGHIVPQVSEGSMRDFPTILEDLHLGKFKGRIVLIPEDLYLNQ